MHDKTSSFSPFAARHHQIYHIHLNTQSQRTFHHNNIRHAYSSIRSINSKNSSLIHRKLARYIHPHEECPKTQQNLDTSRRRGCMRAPTQLCWENIAIYHRKIKRVRVARTWSHRSVERESALHEPESVTEFSCARLRTTSVSLLQ